MADGLQPEKILRELDELWTNLAKAEQGPATASGVLRACAMTLIVAAEDARDAQTASETLAELMHEHPSRAIVLRPSESGELDARVFAQCWMPFGSRQQICCEQIEITAASERLGDVPGLILGLIAPDLPVVLWCRGERWFGEPHFGQLLPLTGKLVVDSGRFADPSNAFRLITELKKDVRLVADLAWSRVTGWREIIAQSFDTPAGLAAAGAIRTVRVTHSQAEPEALYLTAWLKRALPSADVALEAVAGTDGVRSVTMGELSFVAGEGSTVEVHSPSGSRAAMLPLSGDCQAMREELSIMQHDQIYEEVHTILASRLDTPHVHPPL